MIDVWRNNQETNLFFLNIEEDHQAWI